MSIGIVDSCAVDALKFLCLFVSCVAIQVRLVLGVLIVRVPEAAFRRISRLVCMAFLMEMARLIHLEIGATSFRVLEVSTVLSLVVVSLLVVVLVLLRLCEVCMPVAVGLGAVVVGVSLAHMRVNVLAV